MPAETMVRTLLLSTATSHLISFATFIIPAELPKSCDFIQLYDASDVCPETCYPVPLGINRTVCIAHGKQTEMWGFSLAPIFLNACVLP